MKSYFPYVRRVSENAADRADLHQALQLDRTFASYQHLRANGRQREQPEIDRYS